MIAAEDMKIGNIYHIDSDMYFQYLGFGRITTEITNFSKTEKSTETGYMYYNVSFNKETTSFNHVAFDNMHFYGRKPEILVFTKPLNAYNQLEVNLPECIFKRKRFIYTFGHRQYYTFMKMKINLSF